MKTDEFERHLQSQPLRRIPAAWRKDILQTAQAPVQGNAPTPASFVSFLTSLMWPHPMAWGGLAAVWLVILAMEFCARDTGPAVARMSPPPSPALLAMVRAQQLELARLVGSNAPADADPPKGAHPGPRSERRMEMTAV